MAPQPTVEEIKAAIAAANKLRQKAQDARDAGALAAAIRRQLTVKRSTGLALLADVKSPLAAKLGKATAEYCIAVGRMSTSAFRDKVEAVTRRAVAALATPHSGGSRMSLSPWKREADGSLSRTLTAVDDKEAAEANGRCNLKRLEPGKIQDEFKIEHATDKTKETRGRARAMK